MISFTCARCGQKLQVPDEIAGQAVRCSLCKHVMVIAQPLLLATTLDMPQLVGPTSSLARAGLDGGVTLAAQNFDAADDSPSQSSGQRSLSEILSHGGGQRYQVAGEIARGGMGAVLRAVDGDIRREVAVKYLLDQADLGKKVRFIEEAQITGQLEHPNIVPIHELGVDAKDRLYFSMKMVRGRSLQQVLKELRDAPRTSDKKHPLSSLLTIFVNICNALAYAHSRHVVHRDLKPANIMIGDFGEVYVMDWGLAKVLTRPEASPLDGVIQQKPSFAWAEENQNETPSATLQISALDGVERTVDGTVMGTAAYMPPEQASGNIAAIDPRSDIYSLGAVLYEILTLHPPIDSKGGLFATLERVRKGEIIPPQQRDPKRTRAGKVPNELAAVAMKAMANKREDRYQTVEALRGDIERFLQGRSVSVKDDSAREMFVKFVKRNKGFSVGAAVALGILILSSIFLLYSWLQIRQTHAEFVQEQEAKRALARQSVPALVEAARYAVQQRRFDEALAQMKMAVDYDPNDASARLLKGQLLAARKDFAAARTELQRYFRAHPKDQQAARLAQLCSGGKANDPAVIVELADILLRQNLPTLAEALVDAPGKLLEVYQRKIESAWPGLGKRLATTNDGKLFLDINGQAQVVDLAPLEGMPLRILTARSLNIVDLSPLKGMPLEHLELSDCGRIANLKPLAAMPLTHLDLRACLHIADLSPLKGMPLTDLNLSFCGQVKDLKPLVGMPLTHLKLVQCGRIVDLSPLKGMPLTYLDMSFCGQIKDLHPFQGLPLKYMNLSSCKSISDLSPLKGMPLTALALNGCGRIADLSPLKGMPLSELLLERCSPIADLSPLQGMPLTALSLNGCDRIADLTPLHNAPLTVLVISNCSRLTDLTPLESIKLTNIHFSPQNIKKGADALRRMKSLALINNMPAVDFWHKYDAGAFRK